MKNILNIIRHDTSKATGSVVAIIIIMGLCIVPCLYAWFNIMSNWSPYEADATGRIRVAVASDDEGAELYGIELNVGDKIIDALKANDAIGWTFTNTSDDAVEGVRSGDYYAAIIVPKDFSSNVMSFIDGDLTNPSIIYYENEKKNAIAPKITGKAKTALQEQVNATFVETLAQYMTEAASVVDASGKDPQQIMKGVGDRINALADRLDSIVVIVDSAGGLSKSAGSMLEASDTLIGSTNNALKQEKKILDSIDEGLKESSKEYAKQQTKAEKAADEMRDALRDLAGDAAKILDGRLAFKVFVAKDLPDIQKKLSKMQKTADAFASVFDKLGFSSLSYQFSELSDRLGDIDEDLDAMKKTDASDREARKAAVSDLSNDVSAALDTLEGIDDSLDSDIDSKYSKAARNTQSAVGSVRSLLNTAGGDLSRVSRLLGGYTDSLGALEKSLDKTNRTVRSMQKGMNAVAAVLYNAAGDRLLNGLSDLLTGEGSSIAEFLAEPVKMDTEVIYPVREYGSAMAPFYTVLAQWVGALLTAVLIKAKVRKRDDLTDPKLHERFFGRFGLYLFVGLAQALIVSFGDLWYIGIQCTAPGRFILAACVNGLTFMMINYALVFALDNIGLGAGVIVLVLQVAGSGGTYPVEVLPTIFQALYPFMPFRYAMDAMRECIGGMYGNRYIECIGMLLLMTLISVIFALGMYVPARRLNNMIAESKEKSEIML